MLEDGITFKPIASSNDDAQLNETAQSIRNEIAGMFRIPPFKIPPDPRELLERRSARDRIRRVDAQSLVTVWEESIRRDLLTVRQYGQFDVSFDRSALIRSDQKSLHEALARGRMPATTRRTMSGGSSARTRSPSQKAATRTSRTAT